MQAQQIEVVLYTSFEARGFEWKGDLPENVEVIQIEFPTAGKKWKWLKTFFKLQKSIKKNHFDVVHAHFTLGILMLLFLKTSAKKWGTFHGVYHLAESGFISKMVGELEKKAFKSFDRSFVLNQRDFKDLKHHAKVKLMPNPGVGVNLDNYRYQEVNQSKKAELKKTFGYDADVKLLLFVGRYTLFKGVEDAIAAATILHKKGCNVRLLLCGKLDMQHPIDGLKPLSFVDDLGWRQDLPQLMKMADILVFPSVREGYPVSLLEAVASGLPYVGYKVRGVEDINEIYEKGILVAPNEVNKLAEAVENICYKNYPITPLSKEEYYSLGRQRFVDYQMAEYARLLD